MKRVLTNLLAFSGLTLLMLSSCKKNDELVTTNGGTPGTLSASTTTPVLDKTQLTDTSKIVTFSFTAPKYTYNAAVTNTLQIDVAGDNWAKPTSVTMGVKVYSQGYNTNDFNNLLLKLGILGGTTTSVNIRVQHALSSSVITYSNVVSLTVTPFNLTSWIWVAGDYESWNNDGGGLDSLVSPTGNNVYSGIINIPAGGTLQFKLLPVKGSWSVAYGDAGGGAISTSGGNLMAPAGGGQIFITANLNNNTISIEEADYYSVIGSDFQGQSWNFDNAMKYVNDGNGNWVLKIPMIAASGGGFKIRQDDQWANSWGLSSTTGILTDASGGNMTISASGTYTITFNMAPTKYGTAAVETAPYTITQ